LACECYRAIRRRTDNVAPHCPHGNVEHSWQAKDATLVALSCEDLPPPDQP